MDYHYITLPGVSSHLKLIIKLVFEVPLHYTSGGFLTLKIASIAAPVSVYHYTSWGFLTPNFFPYWQSCWYHYITLPGGSSHDNLDNIELVEVVPLHYTSGGFLTQVIKGEIKPSAKYHYITLPGVSSHPFSNLR